MTTSCLYHTQGIVGFKYQKTDRIGKTEIYHLHSTANHLSCPCCRSADTTLVKTGKSRQIRGLFIGFKKTLLRVFTRRIVCRECRASVQEPIEFCAGTHVGYSKWLANFVLGLRGVMSIRDVAHFTGLHWESVKNIEKKYLQKKYKTIGLKEVQYLGIDEVHLGKKLGYITVVRDLESGRVLHVGKGKGGDALKEFRNRIGRKARQIKAVTIDMANAYSAWVGKVLPEADIVYDHFHVIKLMNERMDGLRKSTMNKLADEQKKELKGKRFLFLRNQQDLSTQAAQELKKLRFEFKDPGTASIMKEYLRNIYSIADSCELARKAFTLWCEKAEASGICCLKKMAKTIRKRMEGLISFWKHKGITNASQEGFNNKIGWLTRQAYGYRDEIYLYLKIYDLPNLSTKKAL
jgi:transposase